MINTVIDGPGVNQSNDSCQNKRVCLPDLLGTQLKAVSPLQGDSLFEVAIMKLCYSYYLKPRRETRIPSFKFGGVYPSSFQRRENVVRYRFAVFNEQRGRALESEIIQENRKCQVCNKEPNCKPRSGKSPTMSVVPWMAGTSNSMYCAHSSIVLSAKTLQATSRAVMKASTTPPFPIRLLPRQSETMPSKPRATSSSRASSLKTSPPPPTPTRASTPN